MYHFTRREFLKIISMAFPVSLFGCHRSGNFFAEERVCVHIFNSNITIPEPLLKRYGSIPARDKLGGLFNIGLPELFICRTTISFIDIFKYFWPITEKEFLQLHGLISVKFEKSQIMGKEDFEVFSIYLNTKVSGSQSEGTSLAIVLTLNDYTKYWTSPLISLWQGSRIEEFVIFKDPTQAPYLCDFPSLQAGFKRPPP